MFSLFISIENNKQTISSRKEDKEQSITMRNIDDLRNVIQLQSEEIEKQYDRNIFTNWPKRAIKEIKIRDTLSILHIPVHLNT
jgi:hypothetical protein